MLVNQILEAKGHEVVTIGPDQRIWTVLRSFRTNGIGALVVVDDAGEPIGLLGERDIVNSLSSHGTKLLDRTVREVMATPVPTCKATASIGSVMRTMTDQRTRHLVVVDQGRMRGIISIGDVVKARLDDVELENRVLRDQVRAHWSPG